MYTPTSLMVYAHVRTPRFFSEVITPPTNNRMFSSVARTLRTKHSQVPVAANTVAALAGAAGAAALLHHHTNFRATTAKMAEAKSSSSDVAFSPKVSQGGHGRRCGSWIDYIPATGSNLNLREPYMYTCIHVCCTAVLYVLGSVCSISLLINLRAGLLIVCLREASYIRVQSI